MDNILLGLKTLMSPLPLFGICLGSFIGLVVGSLPGLNDSITMAVLIPITFGMDPSFALCLLIGIYCSSSTGGSIPAILLNIPGTASATITTIDGYAMTKKGKHKEALSIALYSSFVGGVFSALVLLFLSPLLAKQALKFGPPEYFMLAILGISTVIFTSGRRKYKNMIAMSLGLLISTIGMSNQTGTSRFVFKIPYLLDGISLVAMLLGLFGVTSLLELSNSILNTKDYTNVVSIESKDTKLSFPNKELRRRLRPTWIESGLIGNLVGIIPGAGMIMAIFIAYNRAKERSKFGEFGTGVEEGVAAPEAANNAVVASSMIPLLSLGIPGNSTSALFLGAMTIQGLRVGPSLFTNNTDIAYMIILGFLLANLIILPLSLIYCKFFIKGVLNIRREILAVIILILCVTGAYAINNNEFNIYIIAIFGLIGFVFNKLEIPISSLILGAILGKMLESNWIQSMVLLDNSAINLIKRPVSLILLIITLFFIVMPKIVKNK